MIIEKDVYKKIKRLSGFINEERIKKYVEENQKIKVQKSKFNLTKIFKFFLIFLGFILIYHLYTIWTNPEEQEVNIVPLSGRY
jgi:hypothetical protein